jgi:hypothetical protein
MDVHGQHASCGPRERLGAALFAKVAGPDGAAVRRRIHQTPDAADEAARFLLLHPPIPWAARPAHAALAAAAVDLMAPEHQRLLGLPLPWLVATPARLLGHAVVKTIRWALPASGEAA